MANHRTQIKPRQLSFAYVGALIVLALFGCKTVEMPDISKFDLGLTDEKTVVTIKPSYSSVNIRPTPSTGQPPIATINGGDQLHLLEERGSWLKVTYYDTTGNEETGWVYKYLVEGYDKPTTNTSESEEPMKGGKQKAQEASSPPSASQDKLPIMEKAPKKAVDISVL